MNRGGQLLSIREQGVASLIPPDVPCRDLTFRFIANPPADGFSAWDAGEDLFDVDEACRPLQGGFALQALNRPLAVALMQRPVAGVVVQGLAGCLVDLPRIGRILQVPVVWLIDQALPAPAELEAPGRTWLASALSDSVWVVPTSAEAKQSLQGWGEEAPELVTGSTDDLAGRLQELSETPGGERHFDYSLYEFCQRDHPLLARMQTGDTVHFDGCQRVLDLGCGVGIFVDSLQRQGLQATGVERDVTIAGYGRGMGLNIETADALDYIENCPAGFDGVYCSHFVEHLPIELVEKLIAGISRALEPGGVAVFAFPDPESIRSQLLGFWRDPEHVRFYHPELVAALAFTVGLDLEWSSHAAQPHRIVPFSEEPPPVSGPVELPPLQLPGEAGSMASRLLGLFGLATRAQLEAERQELLNWSEQLRHSLARQQEAGLQLQERTERLWEVNRTWAWNDNVTLRFRKRAAS